MYALTKIKGIGPRFSNLICKKAEIDTNIRAGELKPDQIEKLVSIMDDPLKYRIPKWFLNRQNDRVTGEYSQSIANVVDLKLREDIEILKKMRAHRGLRHYWGIKVRGQHTKTTGRRGRIVGPKS